jgi:septal ring factor EnvC (AmiA/AmiB activator)
MSDTEDVESRPEEEGSSELHLVARRQRSQNLAGQPKRIAFLEGELEKLLDDIDRYEAKLDEAEVDIEQLLVQKKKLEFTLDNICFRRTQFESLKHDLDESRDKIVNQQQLLDEQGQQIEEQDQIIRDLEEEFKSHLTEPRQKRISEGRKSAYEIATAKKGMEIAMIQAELDQYKQNVGGLVNGEKSKTTSLPELQRALAVVDSLEKEKEEWNATIAVLKDSVTELQGKLKQSQKSNKALDEKVSAASEKSHEWKRLAEAAEKRLGGAVDSDDDAAAAEEGGDAPQALLLQSALERKQGNTSSWGLGAVFGGTSHRNINLNAGNKTNTSDNTFFNNSVGGGLFSSASSTLGASSASVATPDDSDMECNIKQINRSLKDDNKELRKDLEKLEKAHKKEHSFNQKLIFKLQQKENEKPNRNRKLDGKSSIAKERNSGGKSALKKSFAVGGSER